MAITDNQPVVQSIGMDGYGNPISVTRDESAGVNRLLVSTTISGNPPFRLFDTSGNPVDVYADGGQFMMATRDLEQTDLLHKILKEMRKMNKYMYYMMEEEVKDDDIEGE